MLAHLKDVLRKAQKGKYAIAAFNINNMEILQAVVAAAEKQRSPVIVQTSEGAIDYAGIDYLYYLMLLAAKKATVPVCMHLDHGKDMQVIKRCIDVGYTSVMFDGSHYPFDENIRLTKQVVRWAKAKGVSVEAELGTIGGVEDKVSSRKIIFTEPDAAKEFVKRTGIDALAIAIGTSHGAYKFAGAAKLDIKRLQKIRKIINVPLVLHGASGVPHEVLAKATKYGARLGSAEGVPDSQLKVAVKNGITKVNTDTDLRLAFDAAVREVVATKPEVFDPRQILGPARAYMQLIAEHRIKMCGGAGKAR